MGLLQNKYLEMYVLICTSFARYFHCTEYNWIVSSLCTNSFKNRQLISIRTRRQRKRENGSNAV